MPNLSQVKWIVKENYAFHENQIDMLDEERKRRRQELLLIEQNLLRTQEQ
jgi:hypothetical protein